MDKFVFVGKSFDRQDVICAIELVIGIKLENVLDTTILKELNKMSADDYDKIIYLLMSNER
jgi:hypothetical protein